MSGFGWSDEDVAKVLRLAEKGWSLDDIAVAVARSVPAIEMRIKRAGVAMPERCEERRPATPQERAEATPPRVRMDEDRHVRAVLAAGGFGRLPIPWRHPALGWTR